MQNKRRRAQIGERAQLSSLRIGQEAKVISLHTQDKALRRRFLDMGITEGVHLKVKKIAPLGDPVDVELRGYELCIRKLDMAMIEVEVIK
ncbi:MAG: ferrous iron transport protein A [Acholeplasmataceae bacterium]|nr:ferrous iron transport protein A [Acholeplasmataceae bacterium]